MRNVLLDTGPLVALLNRSERSHERCAEFLKGFDGLLVTTEPVLTEAMYLLQAAKGGQAACLSFILAGGATLVPASLKSLERCLELIEKYSDVPMDFADASLVVLAEDLGIKDVFTLDNRGFSTYRLPGKGKFVIHPG